MNNCSDVPNSDCIKTNTSYECKCNSGYEMIEGFCNGYNILQYLYYILHRIY